MVVTSIVCYISGKRVTKSFEDMCRYLSKNNVEVVDPVFIVVMNSKSNVTELGVLPIDGTYNSEQMVEFLSIKIKLLLEWNDVMKSIDSHIHRDSNRCVEKITQEK